MFCMNDDFISNGQDSNKFEEKVVYFQKNQLVFSVSRQNNANSNLYFTNPVLSVCTQAHVREHNIFFVFIESLANLTPTLAPITIAKKITIQTYDATHTKVQSVNNKTYIYSSVNWIVYIKQANGKYLKIFFFADKMLIAFDEW